MSDPIVSHGRGGAGNIERDDKTYVDGEIVREGPLGDQGDGPYSSGRGGAGNVESTSSTGELHTGSGRAGDQDIIPETATRPSHEYENYHVGRGGQGNVHKEHPDQHEGLKEKAKQLLGGGKKEGE